MNSFRAVGRALEFEIERQAEVLERRRDESPRRRAAMSTRPAPPCRSARRSRRTTTATSRNRTCRHSRSRARPSRRCAPRFPSCPPRSAARFEQQYGLTPDEAHPRRDAATRADVLRGDREPRYARSTRAPSPHWFIGDVARLLNEAGADAELADTKLTPAHIAELVAPRRGRRRSPPRRPRKSSTPRSQSGEAPAAIVEQRGLGQVQDSGEIDRIAARSDRGEREGGGGLPRWQGVGDQVPRGPGDARDPRARRPAGRHRGAASPSGRIAGPRGRFRDP